MAFSVVDKAKARFPGLEVLMLVAFVASVVTAQAVPMVATIEVKGMV